jgi:hypothetical protein
MPLTDLLFHVVELPVLRALEEVGHPVVRPRHGSVDVVGKAGPVVRYFSDKSENFGYWKNSFIKLQIIFATIIQYFVFFQVF